MAQQYLQSFLVDKRNHFVSNYILACETNISVFNFAYPSGYEDLNLYSDEWLTVFNDAGGIRTYDPLRGKLLNFWILSEPYESITGTELFYPQFSAPTITSGKANFAGNGIPFQFLLIGEEGNTNGLNTLSVGISFKAPFNSETTIKNMPTVTNLYGSKKIENIKFVVNHSDNLAQYTTNSTKGISSLILSAIIPAATSLDGPKSIYYNPGINDGVNLNQNGTVSLNNQLSSLKAALDTIINFLHFPKTSVQPLPIYGNGQPTIEPNKFIFGAYSDAAFELPSLVSSQAIESITELNNMGNFQGIQFADVDPVYNYLSTQYESFLSNNNVAHTRLPNLYHEITRLKNDQDIDTTAQDEIFANILNGVSSAQYFADYFDNLPSKITEQSLDTVDQKGLNIYISTEGTYTNDEINIYKSVFPKHVDISFRSHGSNTKIMSALKSAGATTDLWKSIVIQTLGSGEGDPNDPVFSFALNSSYSEKEMFYPYSVNNQGYPIQNNSYAGYEKITLIGVKEKNGIHPSVNIYEDPATDFEPGQAEFSNQNNLSVFNFDRWMEKYPNPNAPFGTEKEEELENKSSLFLDNSSNYNKGKQTAKHPLLILFQSAQAQAALEPKIKEIVNNSYRTHSQIMDGKKAYSEVLFYRIEKSLNGSVLQNFWLENTPGIDVLQYIDTQVKYGVDYEYRIYAHTFVIGTKYKYSVAETTLWNKQYPKLDDLNEDGTFKYFFAYPDNSIEIGAPIYSGFIEDYEEIQNSGHFGGGATEEIISDPILGSNDALGDFTDITHDALELLKEYARKHPTIFGPLITQLVSKIDEAVLEGVINQEEADAINDALKADYEAATATPEAELVQVPSPEEIEEARSAFNFLYGATLEWAGSSLVDYMNLLVNSSNDFFKNLKSTLDTTYDEAFAFFDASGELKEAIDNLSLDPSASNFSILLTSNPNLEAASNSQEVLNRIIAIKQKYEAQVGIIAQLNSFQISENPDLKNFYTALLTGFHPKDYFPATGYNIEELRDQRLAQLSEINNLIGPLQSLVDLLNAIEFVVEEQEEVAPPEYVEAEEVDFDNILGTTLKRLFDMLKVEAQATKLKAKKISGGGYETVLQTVSEPYCKIIEVPVYQEIASVVDDPPLPPQVEFNGYYNVPNKILITFDNQVGERNEKPIMLQGDDMSAYDKVRRKQDADYTLADISHTSDSLEYAKQSIKFKSDDYASSYQVFKLNAIPASYNSFNSTNLVGTVSGDIASFVDSITPNQKAYYMFRAIDKHGHPSNPSHVYELEMVSEEGFSYLLVDTVEFSDLKNQGGYNRIFNRYLQIDPAFLQSLINEDETDFGNRTTAYGIDPVLGVLDESVYNNKKFKIRVTSKSTGRKLDFNVEFKKKMNEVNMLPPPKIL